MPRNLSQKRAPSIYNERGPFSRHTQDPPPVAPSVSLFLSRCVLRIRVSGMVTEYFKIIYGFTGPRWKPKHSKRFSSFMRMCAGVYTKCRGGPKSVLPSPHFKRGDEASPGKFDLLMEGVFAARLSAVVSILPTGSRSSPTKSLPIQPPRVPVPPHLVFSIWPRGAHLLFPIQPPSRCRSFSLRGFLPLSVLFSSCSLPSNFFR